MLTGYPILCVESGCHSQGKLKQCFPSVNSRATHKLFSTQVKLYQIIKAQTHNTLRYIT